MTRKHDSAPAGFRPVSACLPALVLACTLLTAGCLSPLSQHSRALADATAPVVDQAAAAYNSANAIHFMRTDYDAIAEFDQASPVYNPRNVRPLMTDQEIRARLAVLAAFQAYIQSLIAITNGTDTPEVQAAARSAGASLAGLGTTLAPAVESTFGVAAASSSTTTNPITPTVQNGISTALDAFQQFLIGRKVKKQLPATIIAMDAHVKVLCELLESDIAILKGIEDRDYNYIINRETLFLRESSTPQATGRLDPEARREMIMKLPALSREQLASDQQLTSLSAAITRMYLAHHALAAAAQGNNSETLKQKLADLETVGESLGKFYSSL